nr:MAG TPA: hypothetical protein [Caudoviricetes sp.]
MNESLKKTVTEYPYYILKLSNLYYTGTEDGRFIFKRGRDNALKIGKADFESLREIESKVVHSRIECVTAQGLTAVSDIERKRKEREFKFYDAIVNGEAVQAVVEELSNKDRRGKIELFRLKLIKSIRNKYLTLDEIEFLTQRNDAVIMKVILGTAHQATQSAIYQLLDAYVVTMV